MKNTANSRWELKDFDHCYMPNKERIIDINTTEVTIVEKDYVKTVHFHDLPKLFNCKVISPGGKTGFISAIDIGANSVRYNKSVRIVYTWEDATTSVVYDDDFIDMVTIAGEDVQFI